MFSSFVFLFLRSHEQHIHSGNRLLYSVIDVIICSRSDVNTATADSSPRRGCRPIANAM